MKQRGRLIYLSITVLIFVSVLSCITAFAEDADSWILKGSMSTTRRYHQVAVGDNKIYVVGGYGSGKALNSLEEYDYSANTWSAKASMTNARYDHKIAVVNGHIYVLGGLDNNGQPQKSVEEYNPEINTWTTKALMLNSKRDFQIAVVDGKIYTIGGFDTAGNAQKTVEEYDTYTNTWATKASMSYARAYHRVVVVNSIIYVVGGNGTSVEAYDPATNEWTTKAPMAIGRINNELAVVNNKIYSIGGSVWNPNQNAISSVEEYDITTDRWISKASMVNPRDIFHTEVINNKIYVIGGRSVVNGQVANYLNSLEEYDPATNTWSTKAPMSTVRNQYDVGVVNGKIYAIGGIDTTGKDLNSVEEYTPKSTEGYVTPNNLVALAGNSKVDLSWTAVDGTTSYIVKRSTTTGGPYITTFPAITTVYKDLTVQNGTTYYYVVSAVVNGAESPNSNEVSATPSDSATPPPEFAGNKAILEITLTSGNIKEYDLTAEELSKFLKWYDDRSNGIGKTYFSINNKSNIKPYLSRKEYIQFDKIYSFEVKDYNE